jgi:hypothetical protein
MVWKRETARERKMKIRSQANVLVGFGKRDLKDMMAEIDTEEGEDLLIHALTQKHWPPRYRREAICTQEEVDAFKAYMRWLQKKLNLTNRRKVNAPHSPQDTDRDTRLDPDG